MPIGFPKSLNPFLMTDAFHDTMNVGELRDTPLERDLDGLLVTLAHAGEIDQRVGDGREVRVLVAPRLDRVDDVVDGQRTAIVEGHALTDLQGPERPVLVRLTGLGDPSLWSAVVSTNSRDSSLTAPAESRCSPMAPASVSPLPPEISPTRSSPPFTGLPVAGDPDCFSAVLSSPLEPQPGSHAAAVNAAAARTEQRRETSAGPVRCAADS